MELFYYLPLRDLTYLDELIKKEKHNVTLLRIARIICRI